MATTRHMGNIATSAAAIALLTVGVAAQRPASPGKSDQAPGRTKHATAASPITPEQKAGLRERVSLATAIVNKHQAEAESAGLSDGWRRATLESLLALPVSSLKELDGAASMTELSTALAAETVDPQTLGSSTEDLVYTPIPPCRYIDTRNVGGKINGFRGYDLFFAGSTYGGSAACNPTAQFGVGENDFGGLVMNMTIVDPSGAPGFAAIKPTQTAPLSSLVNWYEAGPSVQAANQGILIMDQTGAGNEFFVQTAAPVHVIVDIFGAFLAPEATALETIIANGTTDTVAANGNLNLPSATCPAGYAVTGGGVDSITSFLVFTVESRKGAGNDWVCAVRNEGGAPADARCTATCARVPGR